MEPTRREPAAWVLPFATAVFLFFLIAVLPREAARLAEATGGASAPDTRLFYGADVLARTAEAFGREGRSYYIRSRWTFDVAWPLAYGFFLHAALASLLKGGRTRRLRLLPWIAVLLDFLENALISLAFLRHPEIPPWVGILAGMATALKWMCIVLAFALLLLLGLRRLIRFLAGKCQGKRGGTAS